MVQEQQTLQYAAPAGEPVSYREELRTLARETAAELAGLEPAQGRELLESFVSELFLTFAEEGRRRARRQKQAEGIAAAKARGVKFGAERKPVPEDFDEWYLRWRRREITGKTLCEHLGIHITTVYRWAGERGLPFQSMTGKKSRRHNSTDE